MIPAHFMMRMSMRGRRENQRWKVLLGSGAGNGAADCCADCACGAVAWSGGGAVVRLRTIFFGFGAGGAAGVVSSSGAASASAAVAGCSAGAAASVAGCLLLDLDFACFDFGASGGGAAGGAAGAPGRL